MLKKIAIVGSVVAVAGLGVGGVASALSGSPSAQAAVAAPGVAASTAPSTATTSSTPPGTGKKSKTRHTSDRATKRISLAKQLGRTSHAQWVTKDANTGTFVTHDAVRGDVTAAGSGSITIKAPDGTTETFAVNGSTKIRVAGTTGAATMTQVKVGDRVAVLGTGSGAMTATRVVDRGAPGTRHAGSKTGAGAKHKAGRTGSATPTLPSTALPSTTTTVAPTS